MLSDGEIVKETGVDSPALAPRHKAFRCTQDETQFINYGHNALRYVFLTKPMVYVVFFLMSSLPAMVEKHIVYAYLSLFTRSSKPMRLQHLVSPATGMFSGDVESAITGHNHILLCYMNNPIASSVFL